MTDVPTLVSLLPFRAEPSSIGRYRKYIPPHPPGRGSNGQMRLFFINLFMEKHQLRILKKCNTPRTVLRKRVTTRVFSSQNFGELINLATLGLRSSVREKENVDLNKLLGLKGREIKMIRQQSSPGLKMPRRRRD